MSNSEKRFRDVYLAVMHYQRPAPGQKTHTKDWKKTGQWQVFEEAIVTDNLKDKIVNSASIVINITKNNVYKNRFRDEPNGDDKSIYLSYMSKFSEHIVKFYVQFRPEILDELMAQKKQEDVDKKIKEMGEESVKSSEVNEELQPEESSKETLEQNENQVSSN